MAILPDGGMLKGATQETEAAHPAPLLPDNERNLNVKLPLEAVEIIEPAPTVPCKYAISAAAVLLPLYTLNQSFEL